MICDDERCRWSMRPATAPDRNPCGLLPASLGGAAAAPPLRSPLLRRCGCDGLPPLLARPLWLPLPWRPASESEATLCTLSCFAMIRRHRLLDASFHSCTMCCWTPASSNSATSDAAAAYGSSSSARWSVSSATTEQMMLSTRRTATNWNEKK